MNAIVPAARRWRAALILTLIAFVPAHAADQASRAKNGILTLEVSFQDFVELQRLDDGDRRQRLGLPASCSPIITALTGAISPSRRFFVLVTCNATTEE